MTPESAYPCRVRVQLGIAIAALALGTLVHCSALVDLSGFSGDGGNSGGDDAGANACVERCVDPQTLSRCDVPGSRVVCALGCESAPFPRCALFSPSGVVTREDLAALGTRPIELTADTTIHTDTGEIDGVRRAGPGIVDGIGFRSTGAITVFTFASLAMRASVVHIAGPKIGAIVAADTIEIEAVLDAQGSCENNRPGPGGGAGGIPNGDAAQGSGAGTAGVTVPDFSAMGGSGAGHAAQGGTGGSSTAPGMTYGNALLVPLAAGSGGGAGGSGSGSAGVGGGSGGALQLVAGRQIRVLGAINAGGCGGKAGAGEGGGGGGGSGGAILLEAPDVIVAGVVAANGGGGGASGADGANGIASDAPALGGVGKSTGGKGGAAKMSAGSDGSAHRYAIGGGGGGGAAGRIRINTRTGAATISGSVSPAFADASDAGAPAATQGQIRVD